MTALAPQLCDPLFLPVDDESIVTAVGLIFSADLTSVLAISRRDHYADLGLIGGKREPGESVRTALVRELAEEADIEVRESDVVPVFCRGCEPSWQFSCTFQVLRVVRWPSTPFPFIRDRSWVGWVPRDLIARQDCSFGRYNRNLFESLKLPGY